MKNLITLGLALLFASVLFAQGGKKNKNNNDFSNQQPVGAIVMPAPTVNSPAKEKKDFNKEVLNLLKEKSRDSVQFYLGGRALIIMGTDTAHAFKTRVNQNGDIAVVDKTIEVDQNTMGTFWKAENDVVWVTFNLKESGFLPGDTISLPFRQNGDGGTAFTLKGDGTCSTVDVSNAKNVLPCQRFMFAGKNFFIYKGATSIPLQVVVENKKERVVAKDRRVNNGGNVAPAAAPEQQFDVFKIPSIE